MANTFNNSAEIRSKVDGWVEIGDVSIIILIAKHIKLLDVIEL